MDLPLNALLDGDGMIESSIGKMVSVWHFLHPRHRVNSRDKTKTTLSRKNGGGEMRSDVWDPTYLARARVACAAGADAAWCMAWLVGRRERRWVETGVSLALGRGCLFSCRGRSSNPNHVADSAAFLLE